MALSSVLGTVAHVLLLPVPWNHFFLPMSILYYNVSSYYRCSSVETKRFDSLMRLVLYGSFFGQCFFTKLFWSKLMIGCRNFDWFSNHTHLSQAGLLCTWHGGGSRLGESCLLYDNFYSMMAHCVSRPVWKHPHFWNCTICCWIPSYSQPSYSWCGPVIYPQQCVPSSHCGASMQLKVFSSPFSNSDFL